MLKAIAIIVAMLVFVPCVQGQVGSSLGYFSITSSTTAGEKTLSNFGHFRVLYEVPISDRFLWKPSYSLYILGSGDLGYGMDMGVQYFPFSLNRRLVYKNKDLFFYSAETLRPYVNLSFHQRQYQSIQSNYAGMGVGGGLDYQWQKDAKINIDFLFLSLAGPLDSKISEIQLNFGGTLEF